MRAKPSLKVTAKLEEGLERYRAPSSGRTQATSGDRRVLKSAKTSQRKRHDVIR